MHAVLVNITHRDAAVPLYKGEKQLTPLRHREVHLKGNQSIFFVTEKILQDLFSSGLDHRPDHQLRVGSNWTNHR